MSYQDFSKQENKPGNDESQDIFTRRRSYRCSTAPGIFFAGFLIVAGTLLFLGNVGLLPIQDVWAYWPLILVAIGIARLFGRRNAPTVATSVCLIIFGGLFLLVSLGIFHVNTHDKSWPIALLMITVGCLALAKALEQNPGPKIRIGFPNTGPVSSENALNERVVFGGVKRRVETTDFSGGMVNCVFGGVELDLRRAQIPPAENKAIVAVHCVFGGVKVRIPEIWRVSIQSIGVFANYEDKTIPPRTSDAFESPLLIITGTSAFSAVEIEN